MPSTETGLREWRTGATQAERLAAGVLRLEGFRNIEPQAPLGGGDAGADILCERGRRLWVCAVYFPSTNKGFSAVQTKFRSDFAKAKLHRRHGFVFFTNQRLTRANRQTLEKIAEAANQECIVFDMERVRGVLDSPEGYGLRVAYLGITMSLEDQIAFFAQRENNLADILSQNTDHLQVVSAHLKHLRENQLHMYHTMQVVAESQDLILEPMKPLDPLAVGEISSTGSESLVTKGLSPELIRVFHRLVCYDLPSRFIGKFRTEGAVLVRAALAKSEPTFTPPPPEEIAVRVQTLCDKWHQKIDASKSAEDNVTAIAEAFHGLLYIHPFLDGNGRVARSILMQQCVELFGTVDMSRMDRGVVYYTALQAADKGDLAPLSKVIQKALDQ